MAIFNKEERLNGLKAYISGYLEDQQISLREFVNLYGRFVDADSDDSLDVSIVSRFIKGLTTPNNDTIQKLAKIILRTEKATTDQLWSKVDQFIESGYGSDTSIKIGTGWTVWSSFVAALISRQPSLDPEQEQELLMPESIRFAMCDDPEHPGSSLWLKTRNDLEHLSQFPANEVTKYIADPLQKKLNEGEIDCAFLLRQTFDNMKFPNLARQPVLVARIAVGFGIHMYYISKRQSDEDVNNSVSIKTIDDTLKARDILCDLIRGKSVRIVTIGNATVENHRLQLLEDKKIRSAAQRIQYDKLTFSDSETYKATIASFANALNTASEVMLVIAFEPLNSIIYYDLVQALPEDPELYYTNFNLSKLVNIRSSYGLYANADLVDNRSKFKQVVQFLSAINAYVKSFKKRDNLIEEVSSLVNDLYYPTGSLDSIPPSERMIHSLEDIEYSNRYLPFLKQIVDWR